MEEEKWSFSIEKIRLRKKRSSLSVGLGLQKISRAMTRS
jgi:hypothetical protein